MPRTTDELVRGIVELDPVLVPSTAPHILTANELVTEVCVPGGYTDERLELIERWLSAHFCKIADAERSSENIDGINESFMNRVDLGLNQTRYGQQALRLDTKGGLARLERQALNGTLGRKVGVTHIGRDERREDEK